MGKVTEVWTNEGGCRNLKFSVLDAWQQVYIKV
jgi:hypothetical protein